MLLACWMWWAHPVSVIRYFCAAAYIFSVLFSVYLLTLYRKIVFYEKTPVSIRQSLQQVIEIIQNFTRLYFRISIGLLPLIFIFGLVTGYIDMSRQEILKEFHWSKGIAVYVAGFITWSVCMYFFAKWYIKKLYGNHLLQLQQQLKEIENG